MGGYYILQCEVCKQDISQCSCFASDKKLAWIEHKNCKKHRTCKKVDCSHYEHARLRRRDDR